MKTKSSTFLSVLTGILLAGTSQAELVAEWNFDTQTLTNSGSTAGVHNGITVGTPVFTNDTPSGSGYALDLSSATEYMIIDNSSTNQADYVDTFDAPSSYTFSMWAKSTDGIWDQWYEFAGKQNEEGSQPGGGDVGWSLRIRQLGTDPLDGTRVDYYGVGGVKDNDPLVDVIDGLWHLLTFTYDGTSSTLSLYIDGTLEDSAVVAAMNPTLNNALTIGGRYDGTRVENLLVDTVQYYNHALTESEVAAMLIADYNFTVEPEELSLVLSSPSTAVTGSVAASYVANTDLDISVDIAISDESHEGSLSVITATPLTITEPSPDSTALEFAFDNTVANLTDGESATGTATIKWNVVGETTTNEVIVPIIVNYMTPVYTSVPAQWTFDSQTLLNSGASGPVHDGTFFHGGVPATPTFSTDTVSGTGYSLVITSISDSSSTAGGDVLKINNSLNTDAEYTDTFDRGAFSVAMWTKTDGAWRRWDEYFSKGAEGSGGWTVRSRDYITDGIWFQSYTEGNAIDYAPWDDVHMEDQEWHLVTATFDGTDMNLYLDNFLVATNTETVSITDTSIYKLVFGAREDGSRGENILIDSIEFYDWAISSNDVDSLFNGIPLVTEPIIGDISIDIISAGNEVALSFDTSTGTNYGVMARTDLVYGEWDNIISNIPGTGTEVTVTNTISTDAEFYRAFMH